MNRYLIIANASAPCYFNDDIEELEWETAEVVMGIYEGDTGSDAITKARKALKSDFEYINWNKIPMKFFNLK